MSRTIGRCSQHMTLHYKLIILQNKCTGAQCCSCLYVAHCQCCLCLFVCCSMLHVAHACMSLTTQCALLIYVCMLLMAQRSHFCMLPTASCCSCLDVAHCSLCVPYYHSSYPHSSAHILPLVMPLNTPSINLEEIGCRKAARLS